MNRASGHIVQVVDHLREIGALDHSTVLLIGSAARGTQREDSDTDILIVTNEDLVRWRAPLDLHVQIETRAGFLRRMVDFEDYPLWALRFGQVISDIPNWIEVARAHYAAANWPRWEPKLKHAQDRLNIARDLLRMGDLDATRDELILAASHLARAVLLKNQVFPGSRPELADQLQELGRNDLGGALRSLTSGSVFPTRRLVGMYRLLVRRLNTETQDLAKAG